MSGSRSKQVRRAARRIVADAGLTHGEIEHKIREAVGKAFKPRPKYFPRWLWNRIKRITTFDTVDTFIKKEDL